MGMTELIHTAKYQNLTKNTKKQFAIKLSTLFRSIYPSSMKIINRMRWQCYLSFQPSLSHRLDILQLLLKKPIQLINNAHPDTEQQQRRNCVPKH